MIRKLSTKKANEPLIVLSHLNGVSTIRMNRPEKLNGWTESMMKELKASFESLKSDHNAKVVILTGTDPYYCAGVDLGGSFKIMTPNKLQKAIEINNRELFEIFLDFPKPIIAAINGPAIGASVTSATLCDAIVASEKATFLTPFYKLAVPPEGCSSIHFERLMGKQNALRMLSIEGWKPTAKEAKEVGLISDVYQHSELLSNAQKLAEDWIQSGYTTRKLYTTPGLLKEMKDANARESKELADAFLSTNFFDSQIQFASDKGKTKIAWIFRLVRYSRPIWARFL